MSQLFHIFRNLNSVKVATLMICLDAGGSNSRLLALLYYEAQLDNGWIENENQILFKDPTTSCEQDNNECEHRIKLQ